MKAAPATSAPRLATSRFGAQYLLPMHMQGAVRAPGALDVNAPGAVSARCRSQGTSSAPGAGEGLPLEGGASDIRASSRDLAPSSRFGAQYLLPRLAQGADSAPGALDVNAPGAVSARCRSQGTFSAPGAGKACPARAAPATSAPRLATSRLPRASGRSICCLGSRREQFARLERSPSTLRAQYLLPPRWQGALGAPGSRGPPRRAYFWAGSRTTPPAQAPARAGSPPNHTARARGQLRHSTLAPCDTDHFPPSSVTTSPFAKHPAPASAPGV